MATNQTVNLNNFLKEDYFLRKDYGDRFVNLIGSKTLEKVKIVSTEKLDKYPITVTCLSCFKESSCVRGLDSAKHPFIAFKLRCSSPTEEIDFAMKLIFEEACHKNTYITIFINKSTKAPFSTYEAKEGKDFLCFSLDGSLSDNEFKTFKEMLDGKELHADSNDILKMI